MENIKKNIGKIIAILVATFLLGIFLNQFFLFKYFNFSKQNEAPAEQEILDISAEIRDQDKKVEIQKSCSIYVDVSGAVKEPGVYCFDTYSLVIDAITKAGGFAKGVAMEYIYRNMNLSLQLKEYQKIYIPYEKEVKCELQPLNTYTETSNTEHSSSTTTNISESEENSESEVECVNINTATKSELTTLNGIGESTAEKIIQGRPYQKVDDLLNVSGIGEATLNKFKEEICI